MKFRIVDWNVGACRIREASANALDYSSYNHTDIDYATDLLKSLKPDIITFQELHSNETLNQANAIAEGLGFSWCISDAFSESHMEHGQRLTQAIISRYEITDHVRIEFTNPRFTALWKDGKTVVTTHDRGATSCVVHIGTEQVIVKTFHLLPFDPFKVDPFSVPAQKVFADVSEKLHDSTAKLLLAGDLNLGSRIPPVSALLPSLINGKTLELEQPHPTIPNGERPDRIVYRGMAPVYSSVANNALTDHFPLIADFSFS